MGSFFGHVSEPEFFREVYFRMIPFYVGEWKLNTFSMVTGSTFWWQKIFGSEMCLKHFSKAAKNGLSSVGSSSNFPQNCRML